MRTRIMLSAHRRRGVGDRAALERDCPVAHRDHAAAALRTAAPHLPSPASYIAPAPHRPRASVPARIAARPCAHVLRCRISPRRRTAPRPSPCGSRRRSAAHERNAPHARRRHRPPSPSSSTCDAQRTTHTMRDASTASAPPMQRALRNVQHVTGPRNRAACSGQQAPCGGHQRRYHSTAHLPHRKDRVRANQHTPIPHTDTCSMQQGAGSA